MLPKNLAALLKVEEIFSTNEERNEKVDEENNKELENTRRDSIHCNDDDCD